MNPLTGYDSYMLLTFLTLLILEVLITSQESSKVVVDIRHVKTKLTDHYCFYY